MIAEVNDQDSAYERWYQSSLKFDYFMAGLIAAVFAYIAKDLRPRAFTGVLSSYNLELLALCLFLGALAMALKRLENRVWTDLASFDLTRKENTQVKLREAATTRAIQVSVKSTGEVWGSDTIRGMLQELPTIIAESKHYQDKAARKAASNAGWRDWLLVIGFAVLVAARVLSPYYP